MKKKLKLFLTSLIAMGTILASCSNEEGSAPADDGKVKGDITVWVHPYTENAKVEEEMWGKMVANFNKEFPDVDVKIETLPWTNRDQKILTALAANNGPDVFYAIPDQMPQYAEAGMLLELNPYLKDSDLEGFVDSALLSTTWKDKLYGLPILQSSVTFIYNQDIIKAIGEDPDNLPKTWDEFEAWAKKAKDAGYYAMNYPGGGSLNLTIYPWIWQAGGDVLTRNGEIKINSAESVEALEFINNMYKNEYIPKDSITANAHTTEWYGGKMLAVLGSGIDVTSLIKEDEFDFVIGPPLQNKEQLTYGTTGMFVVPANSDNPDAAAEFLKSITSTDNQRIFGEVTQYIPTREEAKDIFADNPHMAQLASYTEYVLSGVIHPLGRTIMPHIQAQVQAMMAGDVTPKEAADAAAKAIQTELDKQ
ncbi:ABC transporter substrate-binding protein [Bacillus sp. FJAT-27225]|uniref:sugar ABC transporter substrate-binding protein n=1 Tax=Bacillus sp. FJAT-27225 TaxID=1743144 RepID=UPI00080C2BBA|nr:sugar ABC transporter substrate-binding protein [Bacillus sp. FJAT-27225]OCA87752.1 ABC transporter substrate-binding protein [Bacillus sp. FJAT-27225]